MPPNASRPTAGTGSGLHVPVVSDSSRRSSAFFCDGLSRPMIVVVGGGRLYVRMYVWGGVGGQGVCRGGEGSSRGPGGTHAIVPAATKSQSTAIDRSQATTNAREPTRARVSVPCAAPLKRCGAQRANACIYTHRGHPRMQNAKQKHKHAKQIKQTNSTSTASGRGSDARSTRTASALLEFREGSR